MQVISITLVAHNLRTLRLWRTGISERDCRALCDLLSSSTRLQFLDISRNNLPPLAMQFMVGGLQYNSTLECLYIADPTLSLSFQNA